MFLALDEAELAVADAAADFQELLVRTEPGSERHHGLTWMICDMRAPGIEIRPIPTMLQDEHVSRVFDDEVRIPLANVVADIGNGWATALATLSFERGTGVIGDQLEILREITADRLLGLPRAR